MSGNSWNNNVQLSRGSKEDEVALQFFNAYEVREFLKSGMWTNNLKDAGAVPDVLEAVLHELSQDNKISLYKSGGQSSDLRTVRVLGSKGELTPRGSHRIKPLTAHFVAGMMANNKDFLAELRKQVTVMQSGERAGG